MTQSMPLRILRRLLYGLSGLVTGGLLVFSILVAVSVFVDIPNLSTPEFAGSIHPTALFMIAISSIGLNTFLMCAAFDRFAALPRNQKDSAVKQSP